MFSEKERYLSSFHGSNELDIKMRGDRRESRTMTPPSTPEEEDHPKDHPITMPIIPISRKSSPLVENRYTTIIETIIFIDDSLTSQIHIKTILNRFTQ